VTEEERNKILGDAIKEDGSLFDLGRYLYWEITDSSAVLDGSFAAEDLRAIADHMDKNKK